MVNFAHRGDSINYPENTIKSFKEAINKGATGIELDVHKTIDNKLVVIHDEKVDRTYLGRGFIKEYTYDALKKLPIRDVNFREDNECYIPLLEEVLDLLKDKDLILNIEIKNDKVDYTNIEEDVINMLKEYNMLDNVVISSFNHNTLLKCKEIEPNIKTGLLYAKYIKDIVKYSKKYKVDALHPSIFLVNEDYIRKAHENELAVNVYTVNMPELMKALIDWGIDGIITDSPEVLNSVKNK